MPGQTSYLDTPVIPTMAFAAGYNLPDCEYPDTTPAIKMVVNANPSAPQGPWVTPGSPASTRQRDVSTFRASTDASQLDLRQPAARSLARAGPVSCGNDDSPGPDCSSASATTRSNNVAARIRTNISVTDGTRDTPASRPREQLGDYHMRPSAGPSYERHGGGYRQPALVSPPSVPQTLAGGAACHRRVARR